MPHPQRHALPAIRWFAGAKQQDAKKKPKQLSKAAKKKKEKEMNRRRNEYRERQNMLKRMMNLHPAAKYKRILSAMDYWFSDENLQNDRFLQTELRDYQGHARISELASFPKFEHWAPPKLIYEALMTEAAKSRYTVVFNKDFVESAPSRRGLRKSREDDERRRQEKLEREEFNQLADRVEKLRDYTEKAREDYFLPIYKELQKEWEQEEELGHESVEEEKQRQLVKKQNEDALTASSDNSISSVFNLFVETVKRFSFSKKEPSVEPEEDDMIDWQMFWEAYHDGDYEWELTESNEEFGEAVSTLEDLELQLWDFHRQHPSFRRASKRSKNENNAKKKGKKNAAKKTYRHNQEAWDQWAFGGTSKPFITDEELRQPPIKDDGSNNLKHALVKHKRTTLAQLQILISASDNYLTEEDQPLYGHENSDNYRFHDPLEEDYPFNDSLEVDQFQAYDELLEEETKETTDVIKPKKKMGNLAKYTSKRFIRVIQDSQKLHSFCNELKESLKRSELKAIGLDVEYCTLELDIRSNLPAMLQVASPDPLGPAGLIWLDKFPNHGKDMIGDEDCKDFLDILSDSKILKVGVGVSKDVRNLAKWWGITDQKLVTYFFSGIRDLEDEHFDDALEFQGLQGMVEAVLGKNLPKTKEKFAKQKKKQRKEGKKDKTSHWRRTDLTKDMKQYAADDAASSIDVWMALQARSKSNCDAQVL